VQGKIMLSDGRPASNAAVFLGDNNPNKTALDMGSTYYYTAYADKHGNFEFSDVRAATYGLQAWSNGSSIADVTTSFLQNDVTVKKSSKTNLGSLTWQVSSKSATSTATVTAFCTVEHHTNTPWSLHVPQT
jgi:rhamnogalacturonan endolyase